MYTVIRQNKQNQSQISDLEDTVSISELKIIASNKPKY